jgi:hypothetical protein
VLRHSPFVMIARTTDFVARFHTDDDSARHPA